MERFLRYSLERGRAIRLMYQDGERIRQATAQVTALDGDEVALMTLRPRGTVILSVGQVLSADYRRGDEGQE